MFSVKVLPAEVAIKVDLYGSDQWVDVETLPVGRHFYNAITHDVIKYPAYIQQWSYDSLSFQDIDGLQMAANVAIDYKFVPENIPEMYQEYRKSADYITSVYFPNWIKNAMIEQSAKMKVDEIYWSKKEQFRSAVLEQLRKEFEQKGIYIDNLYFTNGIQVPQAVYDTINAKIQATQIAQQKQNELAATEAESNKRILEEKWKAQSRIIESESRAQEIRNLNESLTDRYIQYRKLEMQQQMISKRNGEMPKVTSSSQSILDLSSIVQ